MLTERDAFQNRFGVSRETLERLDIYAGLLKKWNPAINLVSKTTIQNLWQRHFFDSAQIYQFRSDEPKKWADLGSGGGFPALVLAILDVDTSPQSSFVLVESDLRKSTFLRTVIRELGLNATVITKRIEEADRLNADILTARALAPLDKLLEYANLHLNPNGFAVFPKGEKFRSEIKEALAHWRFDVKETVSETNPNGALLRIGGISHV
ncbi:MAG: 16S rRNA (guanine(527)-N(7))-methyltransferase RsmG [Rhodobacterales bacterium]|nr:MAG: 16S rRNA (guanine(527)-N(7))-methyltransferase RsmG [Rhodobacterales bacterium]